MPANFRTLGPFKLKRNGNELDHEALRNLWSRESGETGKVFRFAVGVYIIAVKVGQRLIPVYVGKSNRGFASRLNRHSIFEKIPPEYDGRDLHLFLLARVTAKGHKFIIAKRKRVEAGEDFKSSVLRQKAIDRLEFLLIGRCLALNPNLLNIQEKAFHGGLLVPGLSEQATDTLDSSAVALSSMLKVERSGR